MWQIFRISPENDTFGLVPLLLKLDNLPVHVLFIPWLTSSVGQLKRTLVNDMRKKTILQNIALETS